ncbi:MAG: ABC transporter permease subunit [Chloracidobacterium sp.]|nr:ABC transporter permease subunit [Chloracidobacterium sp.]MCO5333447.1 ABC transporter permease [Pyrinomonadaceae bacterium]
MDISSVITIARQELIVAIRNKWTVIFAFVFGSLVLVISYFGTMTAGEIGFQGFNRTTASLLSLVLYLIPLVALMMGAQSFLAAPGDDEMLFSQPVSRGEVLVGKLLGLFAALVSAMFVGFGIGGIVIATQTDAEGFFGYPIFVGLSLFLSFIFLSLSMLAAIISRRQTKAFGVALLLWFFFVILYDLLVLGGSLLFRERTANYFIFASLFGNPVDMVRVAGLISLNGEEIFGAAGAALLKFLGGAIWGITVLLIGLLVWAAVPILISLRLLRKQDIA